MELLLTVEGDQLMVPHHKATNSGRLKGLVPADDSIMFTVSTEIPAAYHMALLGSYANYIHDQPLHVLLQPLHAMHAMQSMQSTQGSELLMQGLQLAVYLADNQYWQLLVAELLSSSDPATWSAITAADDSLKSRVYLQLPFVLLPDQYRCNPNFVADWLNHNFKGRTKGSFSVKIRVAELSYETIVYMPARASSEQLRQHITAYICDVLAFRQAYQAITGDTADNVLPQQLSRDLQRPVPVSISIPASALSALQDVEYTAELYECQLMKDGYKLRANKSKDIGLHRQLATNGTLLRMIFYDPYSAPAERLLYNAYVSTAAGYDPYTAYSTATISGRISGVYTDSGVKVGRWREYTKDGRVASGSYNQRSQRFGIWDLYTDNGKFVGMLNYGSDGLSAPEVMIS